MAVRVSTGTRNAILGRRASVVAVLQGATGAFVDGGTGADTITDSGNHFLTAGFQPGMSLYCVGATTSGNDTGVSGELIVSVAAGTLTLATGVVHTAEVFAAATTLVGVSGGSLADIFRCGVIDIYSGSQPASADAAETGTKLLRFSLASGAVVAGVGTNGLLFEDSASDGEIEKSTAQVWSGVGLAAGTAGWARLYDNSITTGASTTACRIDMNCSTSAYPMKMSTLSVAVGATVTCDAFKVILPTD